MKKIFLTFLIGCLAVAGPAGSAKAGSHARPGTVVINGAVKTPRAWTLDQLKKLGRTETVTMNVRGETKTARGVRLWTLIAATQPKANVKSRESQKSFVVMSEGISPAAFFLNDMLPSAGNKGVFLVWEVNGKPLRGKEGSLRIVESGEIKPMFWKYSVGSVRWFNGQRPRKRRAGQ